MNENFDVEDALKRYRCDPSEQVKKSVLSRFDRTYTSGDFGGKTGVFWKKPIPLYMVAASLLIFIGLSFFAGQRFSRADSRPNISQKLTQEKKIITSEDIKWCAAENDLL